MLSSHRTAFNGSEAVFSTVGASAFVSPLTGYAHQARGWTYPPACCKGSDVGGDCQRIPAETVTKGRHGFSVVLRPGDHHLVTRVLNFLIPYGDEIPSGDSDFHICLHPTQDHMNCFFAPPTASDKQACSSSRGDIPAVPTIPCCCGPCCNWKHRSLLKAELARRNLV